MSASADRLKVEEAFVAFNAEAHRVAGADGNPVDELLSPVVVLAKDGRYFSLPIGRELQRGNGIAVVPAYDARRMVTKVLRRGSIDPKLWKQVEAPQ